MIHTVHETCGDMKYLFQASSPYNAMEKMLYTLNLGRLDAKAQIKETLRGYLLTHSNKEFWTKKQA